MPIHLGSQSRRLFLRNVSAVGVTLALTSKSQAAEAAIAVDDNFVALLADTHIAENPAQTARGINMTDNLKSIVTSIGDMSSRPGHLIIDGDCALSKGLPGDYRTFSDCLQPLDKMGVHLHLTMGNHDDRQALYENCSNGRPNEQPIPIKHVSVLEGEHANWFLLDTLIRVGIVAGEVGYEQLQWLTQQLDARPEKPAIVLTHHNPLLAPHKPGERVTGLWDSEAFLAALQSRPQVRALVYGHTHQWNAQKVGDLHLINLPPVSYVFSKDAPNGWVSARLNAKSLNLQLQALDTKHPKHGEHVEIELS